MIGILAVAAVLSQQNPTEVIEDGNRVLANAKTVVAHFTMTTEGVPFTGEVLLQKPNRFVLKGPGIEITYDGKTLVHRVEGEEHLKERASLGKALETLRLHCFDAFWARGLTYNPASARSVTLASGVRCAQVMCTTGEGEDEKISLALFSEKTKLPWGVDLGYIGLIEFTSIEFVPQKVAKPFSPRIGGG